MKNNTDIRWIQRLDNYNKALSKLTDAVQLDQTKTLSELEKQGLIQSFEYTHELAWKVMKDYFTFQGNTEITGSRDATRQAFKANLIEDGDNWLKMIHNRNLTSHTYNEETSEEIYGNIVTIFYPLFVLFQKKMNQLKEKNEE
ncbi:nucleotidyltransferase substrate binding protein [Ornithobacterium rhinotracheale]|uniref:nucleotidyltransferase substrate binding protein n=1 Tax=Ornithobacterium rhinotracheale TaxID=28251 RepID=UPI003872F2F6